LTFALTEDEDQSTGYIGVPPPCSGYSFGSHVSEKKNLCKKRKSSEKRGKTLRGIEPETSHSADLCLYYYAIKPPTTSLREKAFIRRIKKPVLNLTLTLTLTLVLRAKHNDVFHCL